MNYKDKILNKFILFITVLSACGLVFSAAYFSVSGLSKTFAGASTEVRIMGIALETSKVAITVYLHFFWTKMKGLMKVWLATSLFVLVVITSMGIYGFLSNAFKETEAQFKASNRQVEFIEFEKEAFEEQVTQLELLREQNNEQIISKDKLRQSISNALSGVASDFEYVDQETGEKVRYRNRNASSERNQLLQKEGELKSELSSLREENKEILSQISMYRDSILSKNKEILEEQMNNEASGELGPLIYVSELTGYDISSVVNVFMLVIMFVFDPLAVLLIFAAVYAFSYGDSIKSPEVNNSLVEDRDDIQYDSDEDLFDYERLYDKVQTYHDDYLMPYYQSIPEKSVKRKKKVKKQP